MGWRYCVGLGFIGTVVFIWVISAEITQRIFGQYKQPFAISYFGVSLMVIYLPISLLRESLYSLVEVIDCEGLCTDMYFMCSSIGLNMPLAIDEVKQEIEAGLGQCHVSDVVFREDEKSKEDTSFPESVVLEADKNLTSWEIAKCGLYLTPLWFFTEYLSNSALAYTSVASTTVLSSTAGLFTLLFGVILGQDSITTTKAASVILSITGVVMTTAGKTWVPLDFSSTPETRRHSIEGGIFGILSAVTYGLFTVLLKKSCGMEGAKVDMQKLFGYIGLFTLIGLWWLAWPLSMTGLEPEFELPHSKSVAEIVLLNGIIGNFLSDYLWALSVVWTTPLVASLGMSLTIPLAMVADMSIHGRHYSPLYVIGCVQVHPPSLSRYLGIHGSTHITCDFPSPITMIDVVEVYIATMVRFVTGFRRVCDGQYV